MSDDSKISAENVVVQWDALLRKNNVFITSNFLHDLIKRIEALLAERAGAQPPAEQQRVCVKCGHNNVNSKGECRQCVDWQKHECEFTASEKE